MFRKIAFGIAIALGSISSAFAWENIGEIEARPAVQAPAHDALASANRVAKPVPQANRTFDRPADVSNY